MHSHLQPRASVAEPCPKHAALQPRAVTTGGHRGRPLTPGPSAVGPPLRQSAASRAAHTPPATSPPSAHTRRPHAPHGWGRRLSALAARHPGGRGPPTSASGGVRGAPPLCSAHSHPRWTSREGRDRILAFITSMTTEEASRNVYKRALCSSGAHPLVHS